MERFGFGFSGQGFRGSGLRGFVEGDARALRVNEIFRLSTAVVVEALSEVRM